MATRVFDGIKFCEHSLKKTFQETFLPSFVQIGPVVWKEMFKEIVHDVRRTVHDRHITTLKAPLEHVVLRWAKNYLMMEILPEDIIMQKISSQESLVTPHRLTCV